MRSYRNPFRTRTSEHQQQQGLQRFLKTYGADVLDLMPEELWDRPVVIRSAPGGGKTSLLRAFTVESLTAIANRPDEFEELNERMVDIGAIDGQPVVLAAYLGLSQGYRDLMDLGVDPEIRRKLFFRFIDSQIIRRICESALTLGGMTFPRDLQSLQFHPTTSGEEAFTRLGGTNGEQLWTSSRHSEREIRNMLDSVLPISWEGIQGHGSLYSLEALSEAELSVGGSTLMVRPLVMFDDGQELAEEQRRDLLDGLTSRDLKIARWYTERYSALQPDEVIGDGEPGRGHIIVPLEARARSMGGTIRRGRRLRSYELMLLDVANKRARKPLEDYGDETESSFSEFLDHEESSGALDLRAEEVVPTLRQRVLALAGGSDRYIEWIADAEGLFGYAAAIRWRELEIVITRDRDRVQLELVELPLSEKELRAQSASSIRESAALFLRQELRLPYYFGSRKSALIASQNVEQFLLLSGNLFEEMLVLLTLNQRPSLDAVSQDRIARATSETFWRAIPQRRSFGRDIQHLLLRIGNLAHRDTYRPKAPYAPGVTGTALSMRDRDRLLNPDVRSRIPGGEALFRALAGAIGHNLLTADLDRSVKNKLWMVLYLNRMLCVKFNLPLGYGGFRERSLEEMCSWMAETPTGDLSGIEMPAMFES